MSHLNAADWFSSYSEGFKTISGFFRNLTELRISAKQPPLQLVIRTKPDHAQELMDHLLRTVFLRLDDGANPEGEPAEEQREESESEPTASSAAGHPNKGSSRSSYNYWKLSSKYVCIFGFIMFIPLFHQLE